MKKQNAAAKRKTPGKPVIQPAARRGKVTIRQIPTGVRGLDEILGGGIPEFSFNIIAGTPGCGKTTLAHQTTLAARRFRFSHRRAHAAHVEPGCRRRHPPHPDPDPRRAPA